MFGFFKKAKQESEPAPVRAQEAANSQEEPAAPQPYESATLGQVRRKVEQELFHEFYYRNPTGFVDGLLTEFGLCELYFEGMKESKLKSKYGYKHFGVETNKTPGDNYLISCKLPKPEFLGIAYRMHLGFSPDFSRLAYYLIERTEDGAVLCLLEEDGTRVELATLDEPDWSGREDGAQLRDAEIALVMGWFDNPEEGPADPVEDEDPEEAEPAGEPAEEAESAEEPVEEAAEEPTH